jgi:hypothetical protein
MLKDPGKQQEMREEEDLQLLEQIREASHMAEMQFLEYLVLQKRSTVGVFCLDLQYLFLSDISLLSPENFIPGSQNYVLNNSLWPLIRTLYQTSGVQRVI